MTRNLIPILLILLSIGVFFFFVNGEVERTLSLLEQRSIVNEAQSEINALEEERARLEALASGSAQDHERLERFIPGARNDALSLAAINGLASDNNIALSSVSVSGGVDSRALSGQRFSNDRVRVKTVNISFDTTYGRLMSFLDSLETSLKLHDVTSISVDVRDSGMHGFNVGVQTYWVD